MILDSFKDIVKHTSNLGFIDMVKIVGTATDAKIEAIDADKTVVIFGNMYQPIKGIDSTVGLSRMGVLKGFIDLTDNNANVVIDTETRNNVSVPTEIKFESDDNISSYRFMSETMVNEQIKVPPFKGATWNVEIVPEQSKISKLSSYQGVLGGFEKRFTVSVDKGNLKFSIGSGPTDRATMTFATNVNGTLKHQWSWPLSQVLSILKLSSNSAAVMKFSDMGALLIEIDSGIGKYQYILPAGKV